MPTVKAPEALNTGEGPTTVLEPRVTPTTVLLSWMCVILAEMLQLSFSFFQMTSVPPLEGSQVQRYGENAVPRALPLTISAIYPALFKDKFQPLQAKDHLLGYTAQPLPNAHSLFSGPITRDDGLPPFTPIPAHPGNYFRVWRSLPLRH